MKIPEQYASFNLDAMRCADIQQMYADWLDCELYTQSDLDWLKEYIKERKAWKRAGVDGEDRPMGLI